VGGLDLKKVIVLGGPTATGKTDLAIELALLVNGEVVSADSAQVYRYMDIGTAKPTPEERRGVPHHMIDIVYPDEEFSVAQFKNLAEDSIRDILSRGKVPVVAGGTGLYISSLVYNIQFSDTICDWEFRERMNALAIKYGPGYLHDRLKEVDPVSAQRIHPNNVKRVIRALEVFETTGRPISEHQAESRTKPPEFDYLLFGLTMDRQMLYERIEKRTDIMMEKGLADEVAGILKMGYSRDLVSLQAIGYKEIAAAISGECSMEEAVENIKLGTRHLAKRQITWFNSMEGLKWLDTKALDRRAMLKILADSLNIRY
jgi:tRNA dimethylallyltransferase